MRWNLPNILTIFRLLAAPGVGLAYVVFPSPLADWVALILFVTAAITDYLDGYLARKWDQISKFGRMLDPIADKAMVVIALTVLVSLTGQNMFVLIPTVIILFREIFVSGLREFLGADASELRVTKLAKWKTTVQMVAIIGLLLGHMLQVYFYGRIHAMDQVYLSEILSGAITDDSGIKMLADATQWTNDIGLALLWLAAVLTFITGFDYFSKSLPFLREDS